MFIVDVCFQDLVSKLCGNLTCKTVDSDLEPPHPQIREKLPSVISYNQSHCTPLWEVYSFLYSSHCKSLSMWLDNDWE